LPPGPFRFSAFNHRTAGKAEGVRVEPLPPRALFRQEKMPADVAGPAVVAAAPVGNRAVDGRAPPNAMATAHFFHWGAESSLTASLTATAQLELERGGLGTQAS
jgi:hypothetical protein